METTAKKAAQAKTVYFCSYKNKQTNGAWRKSREYSSVEDLLKAMTAYLTENPRTTVQYNTSTSWF